MWPFTSYPEHPPAHVDGKTYDYIIVGGGTAGCVVASLLSEDPNVSVLVVEKGHVKDNWMSSIPFLSLAFPIFKEAMQTQSTRWSEPLPGTSGRKVRLWGSEGIGGSSRINAMLWTRGAPGDYAAWSEMGLKDWGWKQVEPYFRRLENATSHPESKSKGHGGPIEVRQLEYSGFQWPRYLERAARKLGLPVGGDCDESDAPAMGLFAMDSAVDGRGQRVSSYKAFLNKDVAIQRQDRLTVCTGAIVSRLEVDGPNGLVTGAYVQPSRSPQSTNTTPGKEVYVRARREVIISSGALATPQLLMLSGIGPKDSGKHLGIPLVKELPAVGALLDHYSFPIMLDCHVNETMHLIDSIWAVWHFILFFIFGTGLLGMSNVSKFISVRMGAIDKKTMRVKTRDAQGKDNMDITKSRNAPDLEVMVMPNNTFQQLYPGTSPFSFYPTLLRPHGEGRIELRSTNPLEHARITLPMFLDGRDTANTRLAVRFSMRLAEEFQKSGYPHSTPFLFAPGTNIDLITELDKISAVKDTATPAATAASTKALSEMRKKRDQAIKDGTFKQKTWRNVTDEEIDEYVSRIGYTSLHYCSSCRISNDEKTGVVDQQLRVHGFRNLRIADASVFPRPPGAHPMAPIYMVGMRCAEFIKNDWTKKNK